jgi:hypothetical protein
MNGRLKYRMEQEIFFVREHRLYDWLKDLWALVEVAHYTGDFDPMELYLSQYHWVTLSEIDYSDEPDEVCEMMACMDRGIDFDGFMLRRMHRTIDLHFFLN